MIRTPDTSATIADNPHVPLVCEPLSTGLFREGVKSTNRWIGDRIASLLKSDTQFIKNAFPHQGSANLQKTVQQVLPQYTITWVYTSNKYPNHIYVTFDPVEVQATFHDFYILSDCIIKTSNL